MANQSVLSGWLIIQACIGQNPKDLYEEEYLWKNSVSLVMACKELELIHKGANNWFVKKDECFSDLKIILRYYEEYNHYPLLKENPNFSNAEKKGFNIYYINTAPFHLEKYFNNHILFNPHQKEMWEQHKNYLQEYNRKIQLVRQINSSDGVKTARVAIEELKRVMTKYEYENEIWPTLPPEYIELYKTIQENNAAADEQWKKWEEQKTRILVRVFLKEWFGVKVSFKQEKK